MNDATPNPCATCGACCRSYIVPMLGYDVWLIATRQRLSPEQFLVACPQEEAGWDGLLLAPGGQPYGLALDKRGRFDPKRPCVFLVDLAGGHSRCGIYADRPSVCRGYPMAISSGVVFHRKDSLCPPDSWPLAEVRRPAWRRSIARFYMQMDIYHEVVARWNARVAAAPLGSRFVLQEYYSYLLNVYDRLDALGTATGAEKLAALQESWPTSPRPGVSLAELRLQAGTLPWLDYLLEARRLVDRFYPDVEPQPLIALTWSTMPSGYGAPQVSAQPDYNL